MGILGYPNMGDDNRDGVFGDYSDIYSNFSEEGNIASNEENEAIANIAYDEINNDRQNQQEAKEVRQVASYRQNDNSRLFIFIVVLILLFLSAVGMFVYKKQTAETNTQISEQMMGDFFYNQATTESAEKANGQSETTVAQNTQKSTVEQEVIATVDVDLTSPAQTKQTEETNKKTFENIQKKKTNAQKENSTILNKSVVIQVSPGGRPDPFMPYMQVAAANSTKPSFDLIAPPLVIPESDPATNKIFEFRLTGIMYDEIRPSAILVIDGVQQLVHKGDIVMGYKILDITKKTVKIQYKTNTYEVCAGQNIENGLNLNSTSTLSKQFGGAYSEPDANTIQFNN